MKVWLALIALTLLEVALAWVSAAPVLMLAILLGLSLAKAAIIAWWFMHLRVYRPKPLLWTLAFLLAAVAALVLGLMQ